MLASVTTMSTWSYYLSGPSMVAPTGILIRYTSQHAQRWTSLTGWETITAPYLTDGEPTPIDGGHLIDESAAHNWAKHHDLPVTFDA